MQSGIQKSGTEVFPRTRNLAGMGEFSVKYILVHTMEDKGELGKIRG